MPNIQVPGYGTFSFPDRLSRDEIMAELKDAILDADSRKKSYGNTADFAINTFTGGVKGATQGISGLLRMMGADEYADKIKDLGELNKNYNLPSGSEGAQWGEMLGSSLGLLGLGSAASLVAGPVGGAAVMGGLGVGGGIERVNEDVHRAHMRGVDLTPGEQLTQKIIGGAIGATEAIPLERVASKLIRPLMKVAGKAGGEASEAALEQILNGTTLKSYLYGAGQQAAAEATQSGLSEIGYKALEKQYNPKVDVFSGIGDEVAAGGGIGALLDIAMRGAGHHLARRRGVPQPKLGEPSVNEQSLEPVGGLVKSDGMYGGPGTPAWAAGSEPGRGMYGGLGAADIESDRRPVSGMYGGDSPVLEDTEPGTGMTGGMYGGLGSHGASPELPGPTSVLEPGSLRALGGTTRVLEKGDLYDLAKARAAAEIDQAASNAVGNQLTLGEAGLEGGQLNAFGPQQEENLRVEAEARKRADEAAMFQPTAGQPGLFGTPAAPEQAGLPLGAPLPTAASFDPRLRLGLPASPETIAQPEVPVPPAVGPVVAAARGSQRSPQLEAPAPTVPVTPQSVAPAPQTEVQEPPAAPEVDKIQAAADYIRSQIADKKPVTPAKIQKKFKVSPDEFGEALDRLQQPAPAEPPPPPPPPPAETPTVEPPLAAAVPLPAPAPVVPEPPPVAIAAAPAAETPAAAAPAGPRALDVPTEESYPTAERIREATDRIRADIGAGRPIAAEVLQHRYALSPEQLGRAIEAAAGPALPPQPENRLGKLVDETWQENPVVSREQLEALYGRVINRGAKVGPAVRALFGEQQLEAFSALRKMGVTEVHQGNHELTFDPAPYATPQQAAPAQPRVKPAEPLGPGALLAPRTDLYTPKQFEKTLRKMKQGSALTDAVLDVFRGRNDADVAAIAQHMVANTEGVFAPTEIPLYGRRRAELEPKAGLAERMGERWNQEAYQQEVRGQADDWKLEKDFKDNFALGKNTPAPPVELAAMQSQLKKLLDGELTKMLGKYGGPLKNKTAALQLVDKILTTWGSRAEGKWEGSEGLMSIALDIAEPGIPIAEQMDRFREVMHHEIVHAARGLFTDDNWKLLVKEATGRGFVEEAQSQYGAHGLSPSELNEEAVAAMFAKAMGKYGETLSGAPRTLYERFVGFTQRLGNGLRGMGFTTPDDIMKRLASGELAASGEQQAARPGEGRPLYSLPKQDAPWQKLVRAAEALRAGQPIDKTLTNAADLAQARSLASDPKLDLGRLRNIDPDEHLNIRRMGLDDWLSNQLRASVAAEAQRSGRDPKRKIGFDEFRDWAKSQVNTDEGLDLSKLDTHHKQMESSAAFLGTRNLLNGLHQEIARQVTALEQNRPTMSKDQLLAAEAKIESLRSGASNLTNVLLPARSAAGRSLAYHRIAAQGSFDELYWLATAKRALGLPSNVSLPPEVHQKLATTLAEGQGARQDLNEAQASGDAKRTKTATDRVLKAQDEVSQQVSKLRTSSGREVLTSLWKAGLLTGPQTQLANLTSNGFMAGLERLSSVPANWIDAQLEKTFKTGVRTTSNLLSADARAAAKEAWGPGWKKAQEMAWDALSGKPQRAEQQLGRIDVVRGLNVSPNVPGAKGLEHYVNGVFGLQQAGDTAWTAIAHATEMQGVADNVARTEQLQGKIPKGEAALIKRRRELQANPTEDMVKVAEDRAKYHTFANDNAASKGAEAFKRSAEKMGPLGQTMATALDVVVPFVKVPSNVFSAVLQYSPVGLGYATGKGIKQGSEAAWAKARGREITNKLTPDDQRTYATLLARGTVGSALMYLGFAAAKAGVMAGFRDDQDAAGRAADEAVGRPQGSVKVGNRWLQMNRISPIGNLLTIGASLYREGERPLSNPGQRAGNLMGAAMKSMNEMPFMVGMEGLVDFVQNPTKRGSAYIQRQVGSVVPTLAANVAQAFDPAQRELQNQGLGAALQSRVPLVRQFGIPGLVEGLKQHHDILGRDAPAPGVPYVGPFLDIFRSQQERSDPVSQAMLSSEFGFIRPDKRPGEDQNVTYLRQELAGDLARKYLEKAARSSAFHRAQAAGDEEGQREVLADALTDSRHDLSRFTGKTNRRYTKGTPEQQQVMLNQWLSRTQNQLRRYQ